MWVRKEGKTMKGDLSTSSMHTQGKEESRSYRCTNERRKGPSLGACWWGSNTSPILEKKE
jgi:hypothetical protein